MTLQLQQQVHPFDLDPSRIEYQTYTTRRRRHLFDAGSLLCLLAGMAILIPGTQVLPGLSGIGRPSMLLGAVLTLGWFVSKVHPRLAMLGPQPLRWAAGCYLAAMLASYAAGYIRGLPTLEANAADRAMIISLVFVGIALVCADGVPNRSRLDDVLRVLIGLGAIMALIGHLQFATSLDLVEFIQIPGLETQQDAIEFRDRGEDLFQVASTTVHYIEFSTVMMLLVPFAIHFARFSRTRLSRQLAGVAGVLIVVAIPVTLSRTGMAGLAVGLLVLAYFWSWRTRYNFAVIGMALMAALVVLRPGLLGTVRVLFSDADDDPSVEGRTEDYGPAFEYIAERPLFGRGHGTFIPTLYRFLDNDWLMHLITTGIVGTAAYAAWHLTAMGLAIIAYRRAERPEDRHLCGCLVAVQVMAMTVAFFFDALSFSTHITVLAILTGAAGAMWRFTHPQRIVRGAGPRLGSGLTARRGPARQRGSGDQQLGLHAQRGQ